MASVINSALQSWCAKFNKQISYVFRSCDNLSDSFSAFAGRGGLNEELLTQLRSQKLVVCGLEHSLCFQPSLEDLLDNWGSNDYSSITIVNSNVLKDDFEGKARARIWKRLGDLSISICRPMDVLN